MKKLRVAVVFGGRSAEHEISLLSARNVVAALDKTKYEPVLIGIDRKGQWFLNDGSVRLVHPEDASHVALSDPSDQVGLLSNGPSSRLQRMNGEPLGRIDVLFPVLHGPYGEDGTIQGLARLADLPCVGAGVLGSAVGMDKDVMKRLLRDAGVPIAPFVTVHAHTRAQVTFEATRELLGPLLYVKPANLGSSVGISRVDTRADFDAAIGIALKYDTKVIVEQAIQGREIECSILGNDDPIASVPGEVVPKDGFY
ncbi:MAG: D-alanine--D-alanine ligase, partial [Spirochaetales bacterium]